MALPTIATLSTINVQAMEVYNQGALPFSKLAWGGQTLGAWGHPTIDPVILKVTNLNGSGAGSFRAACEAEEPRIIVFEVAGVCDMLTEHISVHNPYCTIAGQTAPSPGFTFIRGEFRVRTNDVIMQHVAGRLGEAGFEKMSGWGKDNIMTMGPGAEDIIIDHCSTIWSTDENLSTSGGPTEGTTPDEWSANMSHRVTISNCLIAEGLSNSTHIEGEHSKGSLLAKGCRHIAVLRCLYAHNFQRNPNISRGTWAVVVNNWMYNWGNRCAEIFSRKELENEPSPLTKAVVMQNYARRGVDSTNNFIRIADGPEDGHIQLYREGNITLLANGLSDDEMNIASGWAGNLEEVQSKDFLWHENIEYMDAEDVPDYITLNVGSRPWDRDVRDSRIINEATNGTGSIIDAETDREGYPNYLPRYQPFVEADWDLQTMTRIRTNG
jgi:hypothetical protein